MSRIIGLIMLIVFFIAFFILIASAVGIIGALVVMTASVLGTAFIALAVFLLEGGFND